jgi:hypothetical protein
MRGCNPAFWQGGLGVIERMITAGDTKSDDLKKVRRRTDQRMKQQDAQKEQ